MSAEEARGLLADVSHTLPWRDYKYGILRSDDVPCSYVVSWDYAVSENDKGDAEQLFAEIIMKAPDLAATVIALSEERDRTQEFVVRLTEENVNLFRWQSVAADAHLDHLFAMVMSLAVSDETPRALRSISAEGVVTELRRAFDAERVNRAKSEAESVTLRKATEDMEGRALDAEKERDEARAERDRLRAILACERGERAPEGWVWAECGGWGWAWVLGMDSPNDWIAVQHKPGAGWYIRLGSSFLHLYARLRLTMPTALEAIEAADRAATPP